MLTIIETEVFEKFWPLYWMEKEHDAFIAFIAESPNAGDVVSGSGGVRKVRWSRSGSGKSGGVRVIYFNRFADNEIWLLAIYAKAKQENAPAHILKAMKEAIENAP